MDTVHIGPFPPPLGGISVYLYRLSKNEHKSEFIDDKKFIGKGKLDINLIISSLYFIKWYINQFFLTKKKIFVYHSHLKLYRLLFYFLSLFSIHEFGFVVHGHSLIDQFKKSNPIIKFLIRKSLNKASFIQVVNIDYKKFILDNIRARKSNIIIKNAFLPPPEQDEVRIMKSYDNTIINFIKSKKPLIIVNAGLLRFYKNVDLYGLDLCIELILKLKEHFTNVGLIFALGDYQKEFKYLKKMVQKVKKTEIKDNFLLITGQKEIWPIFKKVDLFIRPTFIDGSPVSLLEAIYFKVPVIASDCSPRPESTILFENRNLDDLYQKTINILKKI